MKTKNLILALTMLLTMILFTSCNQDDNSGNQNNDEVDLTTGNIVGNWLIDNRNVNNNQVSNDYWENCDNETNVEFREDLHSSGYLNFGYTHSNGGVGCIGYYCGNTSYEYDNVTDSLIFHAGSHYIRAKVYILNENELSIKYNLNNNSYEDMFLRQ